MCNYRAYIGSAPDSFVSIEDIEDIYSEFNEWYDSQIMRFHCEQFTDKEQAFAAWLESKKRVEDNVL